MRARPGVASLAALALAGAASAQHVAGIGESEAAAGPAARGAAAPATLIVPDMQAGRTLGTILSRAGNLYTIDGGTLAGRNLYHSFARFDLGQGDVAAWVHSAGDPAQIANVISRVTGGAPSSIYGTLDSSALPNADFWFINPAGILFGQGARIDVPAAAHFSTGQQLRFADGATFAVATPGGSTLSIASPVAFGFLGGQGAIAVQDVGREFLPNGGFLSLNARDIAVRASDIGGSGFQLIAVGSGRADLSLAAPLAGPLKGNIDVVSSVLRLSGSQTGAPGIAVGGGHVGIRFSDLGTAFTAGPDSGVGGPIAIAGDEVGISTSLISASTFGAEPAGDIAISGGNITIGPNSIVATETRLGSTGAAGRLGITGKTVSIQGSRVTSSTQTGQAAGDIAIRGDNVAVTGGAVVSSASLPNAGGPGGTILIEGGMLTLADAGSISSTTFGLGDAGTIRIDMTRSISLQRGSIDSAADTDESGHSGHGGRIFIRTPDLRLGDQSLISATTFGTGDAGLVSIEAGSIVLGGRSTIETRSTRGATGNAGQIRIGPGSLLLLAGGSAIASDTDAAGNAGDVIIDMDEVALDGGARISSGSEAGATGGSGAVSIAARRVTLANGASIETISRNARAAGNIVIGTDTLDVDGPGSRISSANESAAGGDAGTANLRARLVTLSNGGEISTSAATGAAGDISLDMPAGGLLRLESRGAPSMITTSSGPGTGGRITISNPLAIVSNGGSILALGQRGGANVRIQSDFFISSADRLNRVAVDGSFLLEAQVGDVSRGTVERDLSVLDASGVLRGQCAAARATGQVSQLVLRPIGPYDPRGDAGAVPRGSCL